MEDKIIDITERVRTNTRTESASFSNSLPDRKFEINIENYEDSEKEVIMSKQISIDEYVELKSDIREIKTSLNWIKWIIPLFITIGIFISGLIVNSIKENTSIQFKLLDRKLDNIQQLNSMQIQRDVAIEYKNQKK
jgi:hypothetical protein